MSDYEAKARDLAVEIIEASTNDFFSPHGAIAFGEGEISAALQSAHAAGKAEGEAMAEKYIQAEVDRAPKPLRRLGEWLTNILDDDHFKTADRMVLGAVEACNAAHAAGDRTGYERGVREAALKAERLFNCGYVMGISEEDKIARDTGNQIAVSIRALLPAQPKEPT